MSEPVELMPGQLITVDDKSYIVRYLRFNQGKVTIDLQHKEDKLDPLCDKTCMVIVLHDKSNLRPTVRYEGL